MKVFLVGASGRIGTPLGKPPGYPGEGEAAAAAQGAVEDVPVAVDSCDGSSGCDRSDVKESGPRQAIRRDKPAIAGTLYART
jgi:hypothetical protein